MDKRVKYNFDINELKRLYEQENMTYAELGKMFGCNHVTIFEFMKKNGIKSRSVARRNQYGDKNSCWVGSDATCLSTYHVRVEVSKGRPKFCEQCHCNDESKRYDWANMTGNYDDPNDYKRLCRSCHKKYDLKRRNEGKLWNNRFALIRKQKQGEV